MKVLFVTKFVLRAGLKMPSFSQVFFSVVVDMQRCESRLHGWDSWF